MAHNWLMMTSSGDVVQSLNSPFFPPHIGAEPGRAKEESRLKVHALYYANELLVRVRLSFQKLLQNRSTNRNNTKKMFGKRVMTRTRCR